MSSWLIAFVGLIYAGIAADNVRLGNVPLAITFAGYAFSNVGLYFMARTQV